MKKLITILALLALVSSAGPCYAADSLRKHLRLYGQEYKPESVLLKPIQDMWTKVQNTTRPLSLDGDVLGYWQGYGGTKIGGENKEGRNYGAVKARLRLNWNPFADGQLFVQMQGGYSDTGSNPSSRGLVATPLNAQSSRTTAGGQASISDVLYTHHFADERIYVTLGWTDPESFIDENRFAGNGRTQFVNTIFNNEPIFDSIDESLPIIAAGFKPVEEFRFTFLAQASKYSALSNDQQKGAFDDMAYNPLIGGQLTYSPSFGKLKGNYRIFGWTNTYDQPRLDGDEESANWGIAFNMDQDITEDFGVFARLGKGNAAVNNITWSWSTGTHWEGPLPGRDEDVWGIAAGGVQGSKHTVNNDMEFHYETYYQIKLTDNFSIVPDVSYVTNPLANDSNDDILFGMLKFFFTFSTP
ncbi:carbohydrate porin [Maridesulfovibrio hydrothermalis]|uniref:Putative Carbohydrate-selective porin OprB n=1 Tax=Maridesulfovibrio hydrothermalis AM13 = DSM 14728 TaxID=1121451 RepID=L0R919_9BACT|nr:carbohydrate porin [Maridesulfovibrio hydrothermalis]CCO22680.1 putative Carbohydrate-selective porin OprB [Maridesulfovibrio hydrothermalis AM13 = DSM 14728]